MITNSSGAHQIFNNELILTTATATLNVSAGSELTLGSTIGKAAGIGKNGSLIVEGGGVVNLTGSFADYSTFQFLTASAGSTINYNTSSNNSVQYFQASGGRINLHRAPGSSGTALRLRENGGEIYLSQAGLSVGVASGLQFRGTTANKTLTFGADFEGPGTATFTSTVRLNEETAAGGQTYRFSAAADNILVLSGVIQDDRASGTGTKVEIVGPGVVRYSGSSANTSLTPISIASDATLELAKTPGIDAIAGGPVTINTDGTLRLAASHQIADATTLVFAGGLFDVGGLTESLGALTVGAEGGTIDFGGKAGSVTFASLASIVGTLEVTGWNNAASITFLDGSGWNAAALEKVNFDGEWAFDENTGTFSAIPEPSAASALMGVAVLGLVLRRNRGRR